MFVPSVEQCLILLKGMRPSDHEVREAVVVARRLVVAGVGKRLRDRDLLGEAQCQPHRFVLTC